MNKRGISPIIATLLLISFAIALGVVIMTFGRAQVETHAQCPLDVGLHLAVINEQSQICLDQQTQQLKFTLENGPNIAVDGVIVNVIGTQRAETIEIAAAMEKVGSYVGSVPYNEEEAGTIRQIKFTPKITLYDEEQICVEKALIVENVPSC